MDLNAELLKATKDNDVASVRDLLEKGADPNHFDSDSSLISDVIVFSDLNPNTHQMVDLLIEHGADVNASGSDGLPLIFDAILSRDAYLVEALLKAGANPNAILEGIETLYDYANQDYRFTVFELKEPQGPNDEDEYLDFLFEYAEQQQTEKPDYLRVMRKYGCKTLQEINQRKG